MSTDRPARSKEAGGYERMEVIGAPSAREHTFRVLGDHDGLEEHQAERERPRRAGSTVAVVQASLRDAISGIPGVGTFLSPHQLANNGQNWR